MAKKKQSFKGAKDDLIKIVKGDMKDCDVRFFISERGNQRIEIFHKPDNDIFETLECLYPPIDPDNFDDIAGNMIFSLYEQLNEKTNKNKWQHYNQESM